MGSCESSLNCDKCYANVPFSNCTTEIEIDPDIAGVGVLISFLFCAYGLFAVIVWAYFNECLPIEVLSSLDHYALRSLKNWRRPFAEADLQFEPTPKQKRRAQVIIGFVTVLGDQQLVTGVAILIAGLASRCHITFYEFNIVTYLAYFAVFTHTLSLSVLQTHLFARKLARDCRVGFAIGFLVLFAFSFVINTVTSHFDGVINGSTLNEGNVLQCLFEASRFGKSFQFDKFDSIVVLGAALYNHIFAIVQLYLEPGTRLFEALLSYLYVRYLCLRGFSSEDASVMVKTANIKYLAWLQPPLSTTGKTAISVWYFCDKYYDSYLAFLPDVSLGMSYGTASVIIAIWQGELKPANGLHILGFGQIVAIVLLVLTLLAAVEVVNEQRLPQPHVISEEIESNCEENDTETSTIHSITDPEVLHRRDSTHKSRIEGLWSLVVRFGSSKSLEDLEIIRCGELSIRHNDTHTARKVSKIALFHCLVETILCTLVGIGFNFDTTGVGALGLVFAYIGYRFLLLAKSEVDLLYFVRDEVRIARVRARSESQLSILHQSNQSVDTSASPSGVSVRTSSPPPSLASSRPVSVIEQRSTAREHQTVFGPPGRIDTEADIGLVPLARRRTFPPQQNEQDP